MYLGVIERVACTLAEYQDLDVDFINFYPTHRLAHDAFHPLDEDELEALLPGANMRHINFYYAFRRAGDVEMINRWFPDKALLLFDEELAQTLQVFEGQDPRNASYKLAAINHYGSLIKTLASEGFLRLLEDESLAEHFFAEQMLTVYEPGCTRYDDVTFRLEDDFLAGPYRIGHAPYTRKPVVMPQLAKSKYLVSGYASKDYDYFPLKAELRSPLYATHDLTLLRRRPEAKILYRDVMQDSHLLEAFVEAVQQDKTFEEKTIGELSSAELMESFDRSMLLGKAIPSEYREARLDRMEDLLTGKMALEEHLKKVSVGISGLMQKFKGSDAVTSLIDLMLSERPALLEQMQGSQLLQTHLRELEEELSGLEEEKLAMQETLKEIKEDLLASKAISAERERLAMEELHANYQTAREKLEAIEERLGLSEGLMDLKGVEEGLVKEIGEKQADFNRIAKAKEAVEKGFEAVLERQGESMVSLSFDGFFAHKMLDAASRWEGGRSAERFTALIEASEQLESKALAPMPLIDYLCEQVQCKRPLYDRNNIINVAISLCQSFLTIVVGAPGSGKTSLAEIMAEALGLRGLSKVLGPEGDRFVDVTVEQGWRSTTDFIGYYNPLNKRYEPSQRRLYNALKLLDMEERAGRGKLPLLVLLDDANVSPMEYYWAAFMRLSDAGSEGHLLDIGDLEPLVIPERLRFIATMNQDHSTELLTPRLIDRATVISMPLLYGEAPAIKQEKMDPALISWASFKEAFLPGKDAEHIFPAFIHKLFREPIQEHLALQGIKISHRSDLAMRRYVAVASKYMRQEMSGGPEAAVLAFDFAVAQHVLPQLKGEGERYARWLEDFKRLLEKHQLLRSSQLVQGIYERGMDRLQSFHFFA